MADLPIETKVAQAQALSSQVRFIYSDYYSGTLADAQLISCHNGLDTNLSTINASATSLLSSQASANSSPMLRGASLSCNINNLLDISGLMDKWANHLKTASDGDYIDRVINDLTNLLNDMYSLNYLRTTICNLSNYTSEKNAILGNMINTLNSINNLLTQAQNMLSIGNASFFCDKILNLVTGNQSMKDIFGKYDINTLTLANTKEQVLSANIGKKLNNEEWIKQMQEKTIVNTGLDTSISNLQAQANIDISNLNENSYNTNPYTS